MIQVWFNGDDHYASEEAWVDYEGLENGSLVLLDDAGRVVSTYAPGAWSSVHKVADEEAEAPGTTYDFDDGNGPVPAHRHTNGRGWVANTAYVTAAAYVGEHARVYDKAQVCDVARVCGFARIYGTAQVSNTAEVSGSARIYGTAWVSDRAHVSGDAWVHGDARVSGDTWVATGRCS